MPGSCRLDARSEASRPGRSRGRSLQEPPSIQPEFGPVLICLLGPFQALAYGEPLLVRGSKVEALLRLLALRHGDVVDREEILTQLWPDRDHVLAVQSLNSLVYGVQRLFREPLRGLAAILQTTAHTASTAAPAWISTCSTSTRSSVPVTGWLGRTISQARTSRLPAPLTLYRGDLRVGSSIAEIIERERLRASYLTALAHLADFSFAQDEYADSLEYALRILAADPCREDAHRLVMRCRVRRGERAQALRQFRLCEDVLRVEFDALPEPATRAVYDQIRLNPAASNRLIPAFDPGGRKPRPYKRRVTGILKSSSGHRQISRISHAVSVRVQVSLSLPSGHAARLERGLKANPGQPAREGARCRLPRPTTDSPSAITSPWFCACWWTCAANWCTRRSSRRMGPRRGAWVTGVS